MDVVRGIIGVGVLWDNVAVLVLIVTVGIPVTVEHKFSNVSMMLCAEETSVIVGSSPTAQLMQSCILTATAVVQRQSGVVQDVTVVATDEQSEAHSPASNCLARIMSSKERRAVTTRWSSSKDVDVAVEVRNASATVKKIKRKPDERILN